MVKLSCSNLFRFALGSMSDAIKRIGVPVGKLMEAC